MKKASPIPPLQGLHIGYAFIRRRKPGYKIAGLSVLYRLEDVIRAFIAVQFRQQSMEIRRVFLALRIR